MTYRIFLPLALILTLMSMGGCSDQNPMSLPANGPANATDPASIDLNMDESDPLTNGGDFLTINAAKNGVKVTSSGLQYEVLVEGDGAKPSPTSYVTVHYVGTLEDGTQFDSSVDRGEPSTFPLNGVIDGFSEGLQLMSVGSKYRFVMPSSIAYGERGSPPRIQPGDTLIFEVEFIEINSN